MFVDHEDCELVLPPYFFALGFPNLAAEPVSLSSLASASSARLAAKSYRCRPPPRRSRTSDNECGPADKCSQAISNERTSIGTKKKKKKFIKNEKRTESSMRGASLVAERRGHARNLRDAPSATRDRRRG